MDKKYVIGGSDAAVLAGAGLYGVADMASKEVASQTPAAIEQPMIVDPATPVTPDQVPDVATDESCDTQSGKCDDRTWGEWLVDMVPGLGSTEDEETPNDIINRNLGN